MSSKDFMGLALILGGLFFGCLALYLLKALAIALGRWVERSAHPIESRLLTWLQDRAHARALGIDVEVVRQRRKMETTNKPLRY